MCSINSARCLLRPHCAPAGVSRQPQRHGPPKRQIKQEWDTMGPNLKNLVPLQWRRYEITRNSWQNGKIWESMGTRGENSVLFFPLRLLIRLTSARPGKLYSIPCADTESLKPNALALAPPHRLGRNPSNRPIRDTWGQNETRWDGIFPLLPTPPEPRPSRNCPASSGQSRHQGWISLCCHSPLAKPAPSL